MHDLTMALIVQNVVGGLLTIGLVGLLDKRRPRTAAENQGQFR